MKQSVLLGLLSNTDNGLLDVLVGGAEVANLHCYGAICGHIVALDLVQPLADLFPPARRMKSPSNYEIKKSPASRLTCVGQVTGRQNTHFADNPFEISLARCTPGICLKTGEPTGSPFCYPLGGSEGPQTEEKLLH